MARPETSEPRESGPEADPDAGPVELARSVLRREGEALLGMAEELERSFADAVEMIKDCDGRLIVTGMGKSGHIGRKVAATLASTGTPAVFLHPAEGFHGDLGVISESDLMLAISNSGETDEIVNLVPAVQRLAGKVIAVTGERDSTLGKLADLVLPTGDVDEADAYNLVPTASTAVALGLGDALAVALMHERGFTPEDFAVFHPEGMLGKKLTLTVGALLGAEPENPTVATDDCYREALRKITKHQLGAVSVVGEDGELAGIITDGDVRRLMEDSSGNVDDLMNTPVREIMTEDPTSVGRDTLAWDALKTMEEHDPRPIFVLPVLDRDARPVGMLHLHHLVQAGFKTSVDD